MCVLKIPHCEGSMASTPPTHHAATSTSACGSLDAHVGPLKETFTRLRVRVPTGVHLTGSHDELPSACSDSPPPSPGWLDCTAKSDFALYSMSEAESSISVDSTADAGFVSTRHSECSVLASPVAMVEVFMERGWHSVSLGTMLVSPHEPLADLRFQIDKLVNVDEHNKYVFSDPRHQGSAVPLSLESQRRAGSVCSCSKLNPSKSTITVTKVYDDDAVSVHKAGLPVIKEAYGEQHAAAPMRTRAPTTI